MTSKRTQIKKVFMPRVTTLLLIVLFVFSFIYTILITTSHANIHETSVRATAWSNDGSMLISGDDHGKVVLWHSGLHVTKGFEYPGEIIHLSFQPNTVKNVIAIVYMRDGDFTIVVEEISLIHTFNQLMPDTTTDEIRDLNWAVNGSYLVAVTSSDLLFYETSGWTSADPFPEINLFNNDFFSIDFHPTKDMVAILGDELLLYDLRPGNFTLLAASDYINHYPTHLGAMGQIVRWNKDGTIVSCGGRDEIRFFNFPLEYINDPYIIFYQIPGKQIAYHEIDYEATNMFASFEWSTVSPYRGMISTGLNVFIIDFTPASTETLFEVSFSSDPVVSANSFITSLQWSPVDKVGSITSSEREIAVSTVSSSIFLTTTSGGHDELNPEEFYSVIAMFAILCFLFAIITWVTSIIQNYFDIRYYRSNIPSLPFAKSESQLHGELGSSIILPIEDWTPRVLFPGENRSVIHVNNIDHLYELLQERRIPNWDYKRKPRYYLFTVFFFTTSFIIGSTISDLINEQIDQFGSLAAGLADVTKTGKVVALVILFAISLLLFFRSSTKVVGPYTSVNQQLDHIVRLLRPKGGIQTGVDELKPYFQKASTISDDEVLLWREIDPDWQLSSLWYPPNLMVTFGYLIIAFSLLVLESFAIILIIRFIDTGFFASVRLLMVLFFVGFYALGLIVRSRSFKDLKRWWNFRRYIIEETKEQALKRDSELGRIELRADGENDNTKAAIALILARQSRDQARLTPIIPDPRFSRLAWTTTVGAIIYQISAYVAQNIDFIF
ncbi:MAG: hypothetical protein ACTSYA_07675 [Candidatus Kariarchaeaceae archaeon]